MRLRIALLVGLAVGAMAGNAAAQVVFQRAGSGWLGFRYGETDPVVIIQVQPGSPARAAGLEPGDTITGLNGGTATIGRLQELSTSLSTGDTVRLRVRRGGQERQLAVVAGARPVDLANAIAGLHADSLRAGLERLRMRMDSLNGARPGQSPEGAFWLRIATDSLLSRFGHLLQNDSLRNAAMPALERFIFDIGRRSVAGAELTELDAGLSQYFGGVREGLLVLRVAPGTPAARAGVQPGDVVVSINGQVVRTVEEVRRQIGMIALGPRPPGAGGAASPVAATIDVIRKGERLQLRLQTNP